MLSRVNSVISDCLGGNSSEPVRPRAENVWPHASLPFGQGVEIFPLYGCGKNTTPWPIAWTGYVRPATINQAMGGRIVFSCSDPIPPVAVATIQPAEHVLSRSAGTERSSCIPMNIIGHHSPNKAGKFSGYSRYCNIPFLSVPC